MAREAKVSKDRCREYFEKGKEFYSQAETAFNARAYSVCASNCIHAGVLFLDAMGIADKGLKSTSESHTEAVQIFKMAEIKSAPEEKGGIARIFLSMVQEKTIIEYSDEEVSKAQAERYLHDAKRIMKFAQAELSERKYL